MKRKFVLPVIVALLATLLLGACGNDETYSNIAARNNAYGMGTQSILIEGTSINSGEPDVKFKQSISPSDIELGQALEGKTVTKVIYNSEKSITVVLDGNAKVSGGAGVYGTITVRHSGLDSKGNSSCVVEMLANAELKVTSFSSSFKKAGDVTTYSISCKLNLTSGSFTDAAAENITLADGTVGELTVKNVDGALLVTVKNCSTATPTLCLKAAATTFGEEITLRLSAGASALLR